MLIKPHRDKLNSLDGQGHDIDNVSKENGEIIDYYNVFRFARA